VPGEHLGGTLFATPDVAAERRGAAVEDVFDGAPMRAQQRRAVSREVVRREISSISRVRSGDMVVSFP